MFNSINDVATLTEKREATNFRWNCSVQVRQTREIEGSYEAMLNNETSLQQHKRVVDQASNLHLLKLVAFPISVGSVPVKELSPKASHASIATCQ